MILVQQPQEYIFEVAYDEKNHKKLKNIQKNLLREGNLNIKFPLLNSNILLRIKVCILLKDRKCGYITK